MKFFYLLLVTILLPMSLYCSAGNAWPRHEISSIEDSRKDKSLLDIVSVEPETISWESHNVSVSEAWIGKRYDGQNFLLFKIMIDGKYQQERKLEVREGKHIVFERADGKLPPLFLYSLRRGLLGQQRIYYIKLSPDVGNEIIVDVKTMQMVDSKPVTVRTGIKLKFKFPAHSDGIQPK